MIGVDFIQDLGVVALLAAAVGWLCQRLRLPVVLGYLAVGILVGPHTPSLPLVTDTGRIHTLAQLGLVFLIFSIGQGLRLQRLKRVGAPLILATVLMAILLLNTSRWFGAALGWPVEHSLVLAGLLMVSSTAIIGKSLRETHTLHSPHGQTALTVTALDDLLAVAMLTVLTSLAQVGRSDALTVLGTVAHLNAVLICLVIVALLSVPPLLRRLTHRALPEVHSLSDSTTSGSSSCSRGISPVASGASSVRGCFSWPSRSCSSRVCCCWRRPSIAWRNDGWARTGR